MIFSSKKEGKADSYGGKQDAGSRDALAEIYPERSERMEPSVPEKFSIPSYKNETRGVKTETTILTAETEFKGTLGFSGDLQLHGKLEGSIEADNGLLTIGEAALVKAEIHGQDVVIYGKVQGNIVATGRLELRGRAQVYGDVRAGKFLIEEGALFVGRSENVNNRQEEKPDFSAMFTKLVSDSPKAAKPDR